jgi:hypothetical protein
MTITLAVVATGASKLTGIVNGLRRNIASGSEARREISEGARARV